MVGTLPSDFLVGGIGNGLPPADYTFDPNKSKYYDASYSPQNVANRQAPTFQELLSRYYDPYQPVNNGVV